MFESYEHWPTFLPIRDALQAHWPEMRAEALSLLEVKGAYVAWPEQGIYRGQWDVFGLRWQDAWLPSQALAPRTAACLKPYESWVVNAGFSVMRPSTHITPHHGYTHQVLRTHLGLVVPTVSAGRVALRVGREIRPWQEGQWLLFDDTREHEAWNQSTELRIVLLMDLRKPSGAAAAARQGPVPAGR